MKNRWRNTLVIGLLSTSLLACGEETGSVASNESPILAEEEGLSDEETVLPVVRGEEEDFGQYLQDNGYIEDGSVTFVMSSLSFDLQPEEGISDGFNLDDKVSDESDESSCGHVDQVGLNGEEGIDNKIANIFWIFKINFRNLQ